jgi:hypothetical protein
MGRPRGRPTRADRRTDRVALGLYDAPLPEQDREMIKNCFQILQRRSLGIDTT